jgi:hypothetical protein
MLEDSGAVRGGSILEALLDNDTLGSDALRDDHPPLVVLYLCSAPPQVRQGKSVTHEVAQDDGHALADLTECVRNGHADLVERDVRSPSCRRVRRFDGLRRHVVVPWD